MDRSGKSWNPVGWSPSDRKSPAPQAGNAPGKFRAVAIVPGARACQVAKRFAKHRFLVSDAPQPPLAGCEFAGTCTCVYRKFSDRRTDYRRSSDDGIPDFGMVIGDRRGIQTRRTADGNRNKRR